MSYGLVICSKCNREVHQNREAYPASNGWFHCEDKTPICDGAGAEYPKDRKQIVGKFCGVDDIKW